LSCRANGYGSSGGAAFTLIYRRIERIFTHRDNPAQLGEHLADLNLDGQVCRSEADVRSNGIVETMTLDNDTPPCGCPPLQSGFQGPIPVGTDPLPPGSERADRNYDKLVCVKPLPRDPPELFKFIVIDNRRCKPLN
jgi:hypothetical protein